MCNHDHGVPPRPIAALLAAIRRQREQELAAWTALASLTLWERDVLQLLGEGLAEEEIARLLDTDAGVIRDDIDRIVVKLGVRSPVQALVLAAAYGVVRIRGR